MSEQTQVNNQQVLIIGLVVIAALLAAIVGVIIWQQSSTNALPEPVVQTPAPSTGATAPAGMGQQPAAVSTEFDPKTATQVPAGTEPIDFVKAYHEAVAKDDYETAYKMLPVDKQQSYGSAAAYKEQVAAYGITGYNMGNPVEKGDTVEIVAEQVTPQMPIAYTWTFKKVDGKWFCASRAMGGSVK